MKKLKETGTVTFIADTINFREILMGEPLPLATIQNAVIDFVRHRSDVVLFGAQAVNVYVTEPRATQDVDLMSVRAKELAEELSRHLGELFHIATRVREIKQGAGFRIFQLQKTGNRHLVDVRAVQVLPDAQRMDGVLVLTPSELIASKVLAHGQRLGKPKSGTDWRDLAALLLIFPQLKCHPGPVTEILQSSNAGPRILALWQDLVSQHIAPESEEDEF